MMSSGAIVIYAAAILLSGYAMLRRDGSLTTGLRRALEEFLMLVPRMVCALIAAGFLVKLIPSDVTGGLLGHEAGYTAIIIGSLAGLLVPSGPVIAFAIAAAFAAQGASLPALVSFVTGWSVFAAHRVFIFEIPLLGLSFVRLRLVSVVALPPIAGTLALLVTGALGAGTR